MAKDGEKFKTMKTVFDAFTNRTIFHLISQGHFERLRSPLSIGKESNVFTAVKDEGLVVVKIFRLETSDFNRMYSYIQGDPRFEGLKRNRRKIIFAWTQREYRNLLKAREAGVTVPLPITWRNNVLVEEYIGDEINAPKLKDQEPKKPLVFLKDLIKEMKRLADAQMVHTDLSSFNILNYNEKPVLIDFSQATTWKHPQFCSYWERDAKNVASYFTKIGIPTSTESLLKKVSPVG
ncbi:MAG: serine protein kinase RIO [Nanoarchaeota archaeon]